MNVLVTGADGFVGRYMVRHLRALGHRVRAGMRPGAPAPEAAFSAAEREGIEWVSFELLDDASVACL